MKTHNLLAIFAGLTLLISCSDERPPGSEKKVQEQEPDHVWVPMVRTMDRARGVKDTIENSLKEKDKAFEEQFK